MKNFTPLAISRVALIIAAITLLVVPARGAEEGKVGTVLRVHVNIPPTPQPSAERDVGERFVNAMADTFRQRGFTGKVEHVDDLDQKTDDGPVLWINLTDWSKDRVGNINCRFSATLEVGGVKRELGVFDGLSPGLAAGPGRFGASRAFDDAAETAIRQLYDALAKTELIVGLRPR